MKLSFSTKGWHDFVFADFCRFAEDLKLDGIELHNIRGNLFADPKSPLRDATAPATLRALREKKLSIPAVDVLSDIAGDAETTTREIRECLHIANLFHIGAIRLHANASDQPEEAVENTAALLAELLPEAEAAGVLFLIGTEGLFADTSRLSEFLGRFASDYLGAVWQVSAAWFGGGESAGEVIKNLGAYVHHVHLNDAKRTPNGVEYCLLGEGELPLANVMRALRSVNYDGYISLVWDPAWCPELDDAEIVLAQFVNYMKQFSDPSRRERTLYWNRAHTGNYVWKKDLLIDCTFSDVLDKMVELFPDQYAFKYTTLDYTRTYEQFREDVDTFARALIALGVRAGSHVAVWASNVPQWYIAFWATVKLGAVLVTVNTAYKIHEAEYLLRQSDTHTLIMTEGSKDTHYGKIIAELCPELESLKSGEQLHAKRLPFLRNVITVGSAQKGCMTWKEAWERAGETPREEVLRMAAAVDPDDVCNMQYTSGTTGFPKGVMLTHRNIVNNGKCIGDRMDLSTADRMMIQVPMFHCFGMVLAMTASMTHGVTLLPLPPPFTAFRPCSSPCWGIPISPKPIFPLCAPALWPVVPALFPPCATWLKRCT